MLVPVAGDITQEEIEKSVKANECAINVTDPGLWNIKNINTVDYWIRIGPTLCQNHNCNLSNSRRVYARARGGEVTRYLSKIVFKRELRNGECMKREWLLYSPPQSCLYCFACRLLSKKEWTFATSGFNYWKHSNLIVEHENGIEHLKCMTAYLIRHKETVIVDSLLIKLRAGVLA